MRDAIRGVIMILAITIIAMVGGFQIGRGGALDSLILSDPEYKAVAESVTAREARQKQFEQALNGALNAPLKNDSAIIALSQLQTSFALNLAAEARFESTLNAQRLAHSCANCEYSDDFKALIRPTTKK